jgi:hypothetical protein
LSAAAAAAFILIIVVVVVDRDVDCHSGFRVFPFMQKKNLLRSVSLQPET